MKKLAILLAACGHSAAPVASPPPVAITPDAGAAVVTGGSVTVTLPGVKAVSSEPCRDDVALAVKDGDGWKDVIHRIHDEEYWLDGKMVGPVMCDDSPCTTGMSGDGGDAQLTASLTGYDKTGEKDGKPVYTTADLHGEIRVTFSYSTDNCQSWKTFETTVEKP